MAAPRAHFTTRHLGVLDGVVARRSAVREDADGAEAMGKRSRKRRRHSRRKQKQRALARDSGGGGHGHRGGVRMLHLEVARGHDGLLRGAPEPVVVLGVYLVDEGGVRLVARYLYRFERPDSVPCKVAPREASDESFVVGMSATSRAVIVALAIEEDSGRGVEAAYAELTRTSDLMAWPADAATPSPAHLDEIAAGALPVDEPLRVQLLFGDAPITRLPGDDWVDASALVVGTSARRVHRLHFVSADMRNDWTAELEVGLRPA
jgi:hypothetical protein